MKASYLEGRRCVCVLLRVNRPSFATLSNCRYSANCGNSSFCTVYEKVCFVFRPETFTFLSCMRLYPSLAKCWLVGLCTAHRAECKQARSKVSQTAAKISIKINFLNSASLDFQRMPQKPDSSAHSTCLNLYFLNGTRTKRYFSKAVIQ